ncbi:MAG: DEAD/DEAH box helicase [Kofleriaceae bacterium]|nr:DEAD/DEAH box helicase [Kofleriaceae bacterium]
MSGPPQLTVARLEKLGGYAFERGDEYWRAGRVRSFAIDGNAIEGVIVGSRTYNTRLAIEHQAIRFECTCPMTPAFCKHAVALGLVWIAEHEKVPVAPRTTGALFATRAEAEAWAKAHDVDHVLVLAADALLDDLPDLGAQRNSLSYLIARLAVRDLASLEGAQRYVGSRGVADRFAEAAYRRLHAEAAVVRDGLVEEQARPTWAPIQELAALWTKLRELRAQIRGGAMPRSSAARARGTWVFEARALQLVWTERERIIAGGMSWGSATLAARLSFGRDGDVLLDCACRAREGRCTHVLALIDATLDVLADASRVEEAKVVAAELLRPGWSRALEDLARLDEVLEKPRPAIELWWQLEDELGGLAIVPVVRKQTKRGAMTAGARMSADKLLAEYGAILDDRDRQIAEYLASFAPSNTASYPHRAFAALVGHPRVRSDHGEEAVRVKRVQLGFAALPAGELIKLEPSVGGERFSPRLLEALLKIFRPGEPLVTVEPDGTCLLIDASEDATRLWNVLAKHGDLFPPEAHGLLLERLAKLEARLPVSVPSELKGRQIRGKPTVVVRVRLLPDVTLELEAFIRPAPGAPLFPPNAGRRDVMIPGEGERTYVRRDLGEELPLVRGALARLPLDGAEEGPPQCFRMADHDAAIALVQALQKPPPGIEAEWIDGKHAVVATVTPRALKVIIDTKRDWFGLVGEIKIEQGRLELAVLLDAARRQQRFVRLDGNRWVELSDILRARLLAVADQTFASRDRLEISPGAVPAIHELAEAGAKVTTPPAWDLLTERLLAAHRLTPKPPKGFVGTLRPYQIEGHAWLARVAAWGAGACLADDMGLGKTVQAIAILLDRAKQGPALVLAPTSVTLNWVDELRRFAPSLNPVLYTEQTDRKACLANLGKRDVLIASYGLLVRDADALAQIKLATLVIDEAQALKNAQTQRAKAARRLTAEFRIALSGTPLENHLGELWSMFAIVFPGLLGSWDQFRDRFAIPIEKVQSAAARAALSRVISPFLLRRTKSEVAPELPSRTEIQVPIVLSEEERDLYENARLAAIAHLDDRSKQLRDEQKRFAVLAALTRLRLLASHPKLYDAASEVGSSKMQRLLELLEELRGAGHRALVFSQFTSHLALVREEVVKAGFTALYLDGETPAKQRAKLIAEFQAGTGDAFLISLKAGGTGINLTAADYVIHLDPWWNPAVEDQATDRAHRIGQTKPVTVYRLIARGTVEEKILEMHADKRTLVAQVLEGKDVAARLTTRDLLALLSGAGGNNR